MGGRGTGKGGQKLTFAECLEYSRCCGLVHHYLGQKYPKCINYHYSASCYKLYRDFSHLILNPTTPPSGHYFSSIFRGGNFGDWMKWFI